MGACDSRAFYGKLKITYENNLKDEIVFGFGE